MGAHRAAKFAAVITAMAFACHLADILQPGPPTLEQVYITALWVACSLAWLAHFYESYSLDDVALLNRRRFNQWAGIRTVLERCTTQSIVSSHEWAVATVTAGSRVEKLDVLELQFISTLSKPGEGTVVLKAVPLSVVDLDEEHPRPVQSLSAALAELEMGQAVYGKTGCAGVTRADIVHGPLPPDVFCIAEGIAAGISDYAAPPQHLKYLESGREYWLITTMEYAGESLWMHFGDELLRHQIRTRENDPRVLAPFLMDQILGLMVVLTDLEQSIKLEHRDLHGPNICIRRRDITADALVGSSGCYPTMIDWEYSRCEPTPNRVVGAKPTFPPSPELGRARNYVAECTSRDLKGFHPSTNTEYLYDLIQECFSRLTYLPDADLDTQDRYLTAQNFARHVLNDLHHTYRPGIRIEVWMNALAAIHEPYFGEGGLVRDIRKNVLPVAQRGGRRNGRGGGAGGGRGKSKGAVATRFSTRLREKSSTENSPEPPVEAV